MVETVANFLAGVQSRSREPVCFEYPSLSKLLPSPCEASTPDALIRYGCGYLAGFAIGDQE